MDQIKAEAKWTRVAEIPAFPFKSFKDLQAAIASRDFNLGVDPLAAAEWSHEFGAKFKRALVAAFSILLLVAAAASVASAFLTGNYWLLVAAPIMAVTFYLSQPASPIRKWVTVGGGASLFLFIEFLLNKLPTAALLVAFAGLTFALVRAAGYVTNSDFRKALLSNESLFLAAYEGRACTVRDNRNDRVYQYDRR